MITREEVALAIRFLEATKDDARTDWLCAQRQNAGAIMFTWAVQILQPAEMVKAAEDIARQNRPNP